LKGSALWERVKFQKESGQLESNSNPKKKGRRVGEGGKERKKSKTVLKKERNRDNL